MRSFWALPAFFRVLLATQHAFSVHDDLLAFPQYKVIFSESPVSLQDAQQQVEYALSKQSARIRRTPIRAAAQAAETNGAALAKHDPTQAHSDREQPDDDDGDELDESYNLMRLGDKRYLCSIPILEPEELQDSNATLTKEEEEKELARATHRGWELLKDMQGNCIYFISGWWSYSFCYNDGVQQFHQLPPGKGVPMWPPTPDPSVQSYTLGMFPHQGKKGEGKVSDDEEPPRGEVEVLQSRTSGQTRYLVQKLGGGTTCDLTGKERKVEVQFHCNNQGNDRIFMIKEIATCSYLMIVHTPRLCQDVAFLPVQEDEPHAITCQEVVPDGDMPRWVANKAIESGKLFTSEKQGNPIIGGVEVGAKKLVGTEGKVIEKTAILGGKGLEKVLGTLAKSTGERMSDEELKKLQLSRKEIELFVKEIQKQAGEKNWELKVVDTPQGRAYRGIIDVEKEEEETDGDAKDGQAGEKGDSKAKGEGQNKADADEAKAKEGENGGSTEGTEETYKDEL